MSRIRVTSTATVIVEADLKEGMTLDEAVALNTRDFRKILTEAGVVTEDVNGIRVEVTISSTGEEVTP